jgi:acid phosphatase
MRSRAAIAVLIATVLGSAGSATAGAVADPPMPSPDHIVVAVMENHSFSQIVGGARAPFISALAAHGATFTRSFAVAHPSQPNYFALFSGSTQGVGDDGAHIVYAPTLAGQLLAAGKDFIGYVQAGSPRKHNPWESFVQARDVERNLSTFPADFARLPAVSFVIPNLQDDMHDGSVEQGDAWLQEHLGAYADWCARSGDLLIVTFDEDDGEERNQIPTVFFGRDVTPGQYDERIDHYSVLRTIEALEGLPPLGRAADRPPITDVWRRR